MASEGHVAYIKEKENMDRVLEVKPEGDHLLGLRIYGMIILKLILYN
jgi:hypothetical protein